MSRILYRDEWYEEIGSEGHYESEFETLLEQEAAQLFADYHWVPFKKTVVSKEDADARKPDYALVHKTYAQWWVVEVELAHHPLQSHVVPQVRTLARASYGSPEAEYLCRRNAALNASRLASLLRADQPRVLVIVNAAPDGWELELDRLGAKLMVCQVFRSDFNRHLLRVSGHYPTETVELVTTCECVPLLPRMLEVHAPAALSVEDGQSVLLYHRGLASPWQRTKKAGRTYLQSVSHPGLSPGTVYEIVRHGDGTLAVRRDAHRPE